MGNFSEEFRKTNKNNEPIFCHHQFLKQNHLKLTLSLFPINHSNLLNYASATYIVLLFAFEYFLLFYTIYFVL